MLRNKILYLILAGYSVVFAILYNEYVTVLIAVVLLLLPVFMILFLIGTVPFMEIKVQPEDRVIRHGEEITFSYLIKNRSVLPITNCRLYFSYRNSMTGEKKKDSHMIAVDSRSEQIVNCCIPANHCGVLEFSCNAIRLYDYFRIFSFRKKYRDLVKITIYPQFYEIVEEFTPNSNAVGQESDVFSKRKPGDDPSEVFNIREYQEGDRLHRVHWKLSSKKDQLMIKEFSLPVNCSIDILVDFCCVGNKDKQSTFIDAVMETTASLSNYLIQMDLLHYITWYDKEHQECSRRKIEDWEDIYLIVEELYQAATYMNTDIFLQTYEAEFGREQLADLFYIGGDFTEETAVFLKARQQSTLYVLCQHSKIEPEKFPHINVSIMKLDDIEDSLKRVVF